MNKELRYSLKEYLISQSVIKNHYPARYWLRNRNLCIHFVFWFWVLWELMTLFSLFVPISNKQKVGRGVTIIFESVFQYIVRLIGGSYSQAVNTSHQIWSYESYLFLYLTLIIGIAGIYCMWLVRNFLKDLKEIVVKHELSSLSNLKFILFSKFVRYLWIFSFILSFWTLFAFLYIPKVTGDAIPSFIYKAEATATSDSGKRYFMPLTVSGWITASFHIATTLAIVLLYAKYFFELIKGNSFFFSFLRVETEKATNLFVNPVIETEIAKSMNVGKRTDFVKENTPGYVCQLSKVNKYFSMNGHLFHALKDIDLNIKEGEFVVILGYSGSGKTTLLNILAGIDRPTNGDCVIANYDTTKMNDYALNFFRRDKIGYIFQNYALLPNLTAEENIAMSQGLTSKPAKTVLKEIKNQCKQVKDGVQKIELGFKLIKKFLFPKGDKSELDYMLDILMLSDHKDKYPHQLSGGQQQRVAIARALIKKPAILLADEPTGAIDHAMTRSILGLLHDINQMAKTTVILITHNPLIAKMAHRVLHVSGGEIIRDEYNKNPIHPKEIKGL